MMKIKLSILLLLASHSILQGQGSQPVSDKNSVAIQCVQVSQSIPLVTAEAQGFTTMRHSAGSAFIYTYNNQVLIQSDYYFDSAYSKKGKPNFNFNALRHYTLVFTKGHAYGSYTDSSRQLYNAKVSVDSVLAGEWAFGLANLYDSILSKSVTLLSSSSIAGTDTLKEMYQYINPANINIAMDMQLYYTGKAPGSNFSLCPRLDSVKQQRLCRIVYIFNATGFEKQHNQLGSYTISLAMKHIPVADKDTAAIMAIFKRDKWAH
jgi:hypothetical protein